MNPTINEIPLFWWRPHRLRPAKTIKLTWQRLLRNDQTAPFHNFGDELSPLIVHHLSKAKIIRKNKTDSPKLIALGSALAAARQGDTCWGTGTLGNEKISDLSQVIFCAVRGPLTHKRVMDHGGQSPEIFGDPGMLTAKLFTASQNKKFSIGIIPHYYDYKKLVQAVLDPKVLIINPMNSPSSVIKEINQCEMVISSSLHGIIVAESYGIPAVWMKISRRIEGGSFKYLDYYQSTDRDNQPLDWSQGINLQKASHEAEKSSALNFNLEPLLQSFPFLNPQIKRLADISPIDLD